MRGSGCRSSWRCPVDQLVVQVAESKKSRSEKNWGSVNKKEHGNTQRKQKQDSARAAIDFEMAAAACVYIDGVNGSGFREYRCLWLRSRI